MLSDGKKQGNLFQIALEHLLDKNNSLYILANQIDWDTFSDTFHELYCHSNGRPAKPIRLMVGLHYLKYTYNLSDEEVVYRWVENPYWQYFCGEKFFQYKLPIDPTSMTRWRKRVEDHDLDKLLQATIETGLKIKAIRKTDFMNTNADTTVAEKNISFPTDARLAYKMIIKLGNLAKSNGIELRQSFIRVGKKRLLIQGRLRRGNRHRKANKEVKKLKTYLSKLMRDISRKGSVEFMQSKKYLDLKEKAERLLAQKKYSKNKLYSIDEPDVECISKGKAHKKYEFGNKVGVVTTARNCFVLSSIAFHDNPYDGHTLAENIEHAKKMISGIGKINRVCVDQGYKKHNYEGDDIEVNIVKRGWRNFPESHADG